MSNNNGIESIPYAVFVEMSKNKLMKLHREIFHKYIRKWWNLRAETGELERMIKCPGIKLLFANERKFINEKCGLIERLHVDICEILKIKKDEEQEMRKRIISRVDKLELEQKVMFAG